MERLSYKTLDQIGFDGYLLREAPERILQFGEGNFMRAFVEDFTDQMNEKAGFHSKVVLVQPRPAHASPDPRELLNEQEGLYTLCLRGSQSGRKTERTRVISCVSRCLNAYSDYEEVMQCAANPDLRFITSNTTEAGIVYDPACRLTDRPAASFPAKLTQFLYRRYQLFGTVPGKGFIILPCELIDDNGKALEDCVLRHAADWQLGEGFTAWLQKENLFCSTLVDRIVTGYPQAGDRELAVKHGYEDRMADTGELFGLWVIEGPASLREELPFEKAGLPVLLTDDHHPYKERKVRILNGVHTAIVPGAFLSGRDIVRDCMRDEVIRGYMDRAVYEEIIPTLSLPEKELKEFAASVTDRFDNPFIDHRLLSIALNSTSKWKTRILPSLTAFAKQHGGQLPPCLCASLAFCLAFYHGRDLTEAGLTGTREDGSLYVVSDSRFVLEFHASHRDDAPSEYVRAVLSNTDFWGQDLTALPGLYETVLADYQYIEEHGCRGLMEMLSAS